jgi:hypothetical protein
MFLLAHQLRVLFLLRLPPALSGSTAFPDFARLGLLRFFGVLAVDLDEDFFDARVGVGVDKVAEQVSQAEKVSEAADGIVFL